MRWCLFILNLLVLLTLSVEQCFWAAASAEKDATHLVCVLDDDEAELKQDLLPHEHAVSEYDDAPSMSHHWHEALRLAQADLVAPHTGAENRTVCTGVRRHRWLCQERC